MVEIEICLGCDDSEHIAQQVKAAYSGGATRVELCSSMEHEGLTPSADALHKAKIAAPEGLLLLAMIRPRAGDFCYSMGEIEQMKREITLASQAGMHGVVLGALTRANALDIPALEQLLAVASEAKLQVTFHRAFDALRTPVASIMALAELGVQRILSAGAPWGAESNAAQHVGSLQSYLDGANGCLELVIAGSVNATNATTIAGKLTSSVGYSFHAYSSVLSHGLVDESKVRQLYQAVNDA